MPLQVPVPEHFTNGCPRAMGMHLDNLMLAIEAIDLEGVEVLLAVVNQLELEKWIPHRVAFWQLRNTNPLRRQHQRQKLDWEEATALLMATCTVARQLNSVLRFLLTTHQQVMEDKIESLGLHQNRAYLDFYTSRFKDLYKSRMRPTAILSDQESIDLAVHALRQLFYAGGAAGQQRLWHSLLMGAEE